MKHSGIDPFLNGTGQKLYRRAKQLIPGGTQLLSKRPEMFAPDVWPAYYSRSKGCRVWDLDSNEYIDMSIMGIGANILGYADDDVDNAVIEAIKQGTSSSLNCPEEIELAQLLIELHPWAGMVRYTRSGGEAMAVAVRIARAATKRDKVLFSGYHGWSDWYLAANLGDTDSLDGQLLPGLEPNGVPRNLKDTAIPFHINDIDNLQSLIAGEERNIAAIVVEPARGEDAPLESLLRLKEIAADIGAVLIFDEITSGFRMCAGGIHLRYKVNPDIAVFAKSIANGYAMAAVIGVEKIMQAAQTSFISSTNWTERVGSVAALATIRKYIKSDVAQHIIGIGNSVKDIWKTSAKKWGLDINVSGLPTLGHMTFKHDHADIINTYFTIAALQKGFLGYRQFKPSLAHSLNEINLYSRVVDEIFESISNTDPSELLSTEPAHQGFHRLTTE
jgi:glutamate-1-semialdehyde 2,1-aminomutase